MKKIHASVPAETGRGIRGSQNPSTGLMKAHGRPFAVGGRSEFDPVLSWAKRPNETRTSRFVGSVYSAAHDGSALQEYPARLSE